jgi:phosphopantothenoylcysteine decarboxylase/phosphopantothenate--cysteine ligase
MTKILLGVCGGIAAYKSVYLASLMVKRNFDVRIILTENACRFITPLTFKAITSNHVYTGLWDNSLREDHTALSEWADLIIVAPVTANTLAKITHGFADNLLTSVILDYDGPVFLCPAMHEKMWNNPATGSNVEKLIKREFLIFGPVSGDLVGGKKGMGRMIEPDKILDKVISTIKKDYKNIKID